MHQFPFFFLVFSLSITCFYFFGGICFRLNGIKAKNSFQSVFGNIFLGYVISIIIFSILKTSGATINVLFLLLLAFLAFEYKQIRQDGEPVVRTNTNSQKLIVTGISVAGFLMLFIWSWFAITSNNSDFIFNYNNGDYILYSRIAKSIGETGQENSFYFLNTLDNYYHEVEPYHYFDLWGASLIASVFSINHFIALKLIIHPTFYFLVFLAFVSLLQKWYLKFTIGFLLLFLGGIYLNVYSTNAFLSTLSDLKYSLVTPNISKLSYFYVFFAASYLLYIKRYYILSVLILLGLPIANIISFPVYAAILLSSSLALFSSRLSRIDFQKILLYSICTIIGIAAFYFLFKNNSIGLAAAQISSPLEMIVGKIDFSSIITRFNILAGGLLHLAVLYFPLLLFVVFCFHSFKIDLKKYQAVLVFSSLLVIMSLLSWAFLFKELNASQVFTNTSIALIGFLISISFIEICNEAKGNHYVILVIFSFLTFRFFSSVSSVLETKSIPHSIPYLKSISKILDEKNIRKGASIKDSSLLIRPHEKYNAVYPLGDYLTLINDNVAIVNIGDFNTPIDSSSAMTLDRSIKAIRNGIFYRYVKGRSLNNSNSFNVSKLQNEFITINSIEFLILSPKACESFDTIRNIESIIKDPKTGECFMILKQSSKN